MTEELPTPPWSVSWHEVVKSEIACVRREMANDKEAAQRALSLASEAQTAHTRSLVSGAFIVIALLELALNFWRHG